MATDYSMTYSDASDASFVTMPHVVCPFTRSSDFLMLNYAPYTAVPSRLSPNPHVSPRRAFRSLQQSFQNPRSFTFPRFGRITYDGSIGTTISSSGRVLPLLRHRVCAYERRRWQSMEYCKRARPRGRCCVWWRIGQPASQLELRPRGYGEGYRQQTQGIYDAIIIGATENTADP